MEAVNCNLCGGVAVVPFISAADLLLERLDVQAMFVRCASCGLVYQNPRPTMAEMGAHYPPTYELYNDVIARQPGGLHRQAVDYGMRKRSRFVTRYQPNGGRLLDIGCAMGAFLVAMRQQIGWQVQGVEVTAAVAQATQAQYQLDVFAGTLEEAAFPSAHFEAVTLWDVLEHLPDPQQTLHEIQRILKPGGVVVIRVPNLASWDATLFKHNWIGFDAPRHLYVFTPQTLARMLASAGFTVLEHSCRLGSYMTFVMSVRGWLTARRLSPTLKQRLTNLLYHPLVRVASAPFFYLPSVMLRGPSLITTARK